MRLEPCGERRRLLPASKALTGRSLALEHIPQPDQQIEVSCPAIVPIGFLARLGYFAFQAQQLSASGGITGGFVARFSETATDIFEFGQQPVGLSVALSQASQLEAPALKVAHRPGRGAALADDAGGEEELSHIVPGHRFWTSELGQINGEHRAEQRFVCAAERPAEVLFGCRSSIRSPDADQPVRAGVTLDPPLPVVVRRVGAAFGQCELATVASPPDRCAKSGIVAAVGNAEQHCGEEVEQRRLAGFVRPAHDHKARGEVVDPEVSQPSKAFDVEARDAHDEPGAP